MKYRRFGRTEMLLSQFTLGCMQITGESPEDRAIATIERAVELGVNHIETARGYGNSEERVGKALSKSITCSSSLTASPVTAKPPMVPVTSLVVLV